MLEDISIEECTKGKKKDFVFIDVRSPSEYAEATIPGSVNIPIFSDEERAEVGTIYTQVSKEAAMDRGLEILSAKLPSFIHQFKELPNHKVVFCWRGGMRSKTVVTLLSLMNIHAYRLSGGYRGYRQWTVNQLESFVFEPPGITLHGNTGCGKTAILKRLQQLGYPALDIEGQAGHRGSVFGHIGLKSHNQKKFDSLLLHELLSLQDAPYILLEAESKRVGKIVLPEFIVDKKEKGRHIRVRLPIEARVQNILEDYQPWDFPDNCKDAFRKIKSRIHTPIAAEIENCLKTEQYGRAVELLLTYYYDPRYAHTEEALTEADFTTITADSVEDAVAQLERLLPNPHQSQGCPNPIDQLSIK